jgi:hypothetical protein
MMGGRLRIATLQPSLALPDAEPAQSLDIFGRVVAMPAGGAARSWHRAEALSESQPRARDSQKLCGFADFVRPLLIKHAGIFESDL